jgi:hypothetical protein
MQTRIDKRKSTRNEAHSRRKDRPDPFLYQISGNDPRHRHEPCPPYQSNVWQSQRFHRAMTKGGGPSGAVVTDPPRTDEPAGGASGAASVAGGLPGSTTTRVPTFTRV